MGRTKRDLEERVGQLEDLLEDLLDEIQEAIGEEEETSEKS